MVTTSLISTIEYGTAEFKGGRTSIFVEHPGRPKEVTTTEMFVKIYGIVIDDRRVMVC